MSYRLRAGKPLEAEVKRIARERLEAAEEALRSQGGDRHEAIHTARKNFKKLRGLYRLVRTGAPVLYENENARIRDVARSLSDVRDATALIEAVDGLRRHIADQHAPDALAAIQATLVERRDRIAGSEDAPDARMVAAADACRDAGHVIADLDLDGRKAGKIVAGGWRKVCAQARRAIAACETRGGAADFHDLRKRVKYHGMHARLLDDAWPSAMKLRRREAKALGDLLGDEHNLSLLAGLMGSEPDAVGRPAEREIVERLIADRRAELRAAGLARARVLFRETARCSAGRTALLWRMAKD